MIHSFRPFFLQPAFGAALLMGIFLISSGGVVWAAERTLPGERLYLVKTRVTEPLRSVLTLAPARKAEWEAELIDRRVGELTELEATARLDEVKRDSLETGLQQHVERLETLSQEVSEDQEAEFQERIRAQLRQNNLIEWQESGRRIRVRIREKRAYVPSDEPDRSELRETETPEDESGEGGDESTGEGLNEMQENRKSGEGTVEKTIPREGHEERKSQSEQILLPSKSKPQSSTASGSSGSVDSEDEDESDREEDDEEGDRDEEDETSLISESTARSKALQAVAGTVQEAKLEKKANQSVWKVEIERASDGEVVKVTVNAYSGSIIDVDD